AGAVIAALTEVVRSGHPVRRWEAADALGQFGPEAETAVPLLIRALREDIAGQSDWPNFYVGGPAARSLGRVAPGTRPPDPSLPALTEAVESRAGVQTMTPYAAIEALGAFGPAAARAIPRLREYQKSQEPFLRLAVEKALAAINAEGPG